MCTFSRLVNTQSDGSSRFSQLMLTEYSPLQTATHLQGYPVRETGNTSASPKCAQLGKASCLLFRGFTCLLCWPGGQLSVKRALPAAGLLACLVGVGGSCTSPSLLLVSLALQDLGNKSTPAVNPQFTHGCRPASLELCLSAALRHAVEPISRQDDTLFDQMERQKQVVVTEWISGRSSVSHFLQDQRLASHTV